MKKIYPVILAGGSGSRLWPLSRRSYPKQFSKIFGDQSLFQLAAKRVQSANLKFEKPLTITNNDFRFIVIQQLQEIGINPESVLIEPEGKNTAAAIAAAAKFVNLSDPDGILLIVSADHLMPDITAFHEAVLKGVSVLDDKNIVTFGILPSAPKTGYGYLKLASNPKKGMAEVVNFVEKPTLKVAEKMLNDEKYLWNAGIFLFSSNSILRSLEEYAPSVFQPATAAVQNSQIDLGFVRLDEAKWSEVESISIDYAVMEKHKNIIAVPFNGEWSDLGSWDAVHNEMITDTNGVALSPNAYAMDCKNTLLRSESEDQKIVGIGLDNIVAIAMPDAVLVADKTQTEDVKKMVSLLHENDVSQATIFPKDHRPWGWFETLKLSERFQVKRIHVNPGAALSLQSHHHRSEHWIVVEGTAKVTVDQDIKIISEGEAAYIPLGAMHRMENPGKIPMVLIEVQTGSYLGEDDIIRYEDMYERG